MAVELLNRVLSTKTTSPRQHGRHDRLKGFPYRQETEQLYAINRRAQRTKMWSRVRNPCRACSQGRSVMVTIFCWCGLVFTFGALLISFYKDSHDESEQSVDVVFDLSVAELLLTLMAVFITLAKQTTLAKQVDDTRSDLERHSDSTHLSSRHDVSVVMPNDDDDDDDDEKGLLSCWTSRSTTSKFLFIALFGWLTSSIVLIGSFVGFYIADRENHYYLRQMKYTTSLVLFLSIICDAIITEIFHEALAHAKLDVCRLVALQLKSELYHELSEGGKADRIEVLEDYLASTRQFSHHKLNHITLCDGIFVFAKDRLSVDNVSQSKFENVSIDRSPATEMRMTTLMKSNAIVKTSNDTEECVVLETKDLNEG